MALWPTPHHENARCLPRVERSNHVGGPYWYRESADKLTGELPVPRIVASEHAEQSRDADAPACARRTLTGRCGDGASPRAVCRSGRPQGTSLWPKLISGARIATESKVRSGGASAITV